MSEVNMFERASRIALRFTTSKGNLTIEDLWKLPLEGDRELSLDAVAIDLRQQLRNSQEESFVSAQTQANELLMLKFNVAKHIIETRLADRKAAAEMAAKRAMKEKLLQLRAKKQDESLESLSMEELDKLIAEG